MNTDARVQAQQYYQSAGRDMAADLEALRQHPQGVVLMMPQLVALMKPSLAIFCPEFLCQEDSLGRFKIVMKMEPSLSSHRMNVPYLCC